MKKFSLLALAAAGMLLGACSDKDVVAENTINQYDMIEGQPAWIAVGIALPDDNAVTRSNVDLNDGLATEFEVKSAMLVLFKGTNEDDATLIKGYNIESYTFENETGDQVPEGNTEGSSANGFGEVSRTSKKIIQEIESPSLGTEDNLYGYVILNYSGNATGLDYVEGTKFSTFKTKVLKAIGIGSAESKGYGSIGNNGLVMTNVPISATPGGTQASAGVITTLAPISKDAIYKTQAEANAGSNVACIYVERAAVKVEVQNQVSQVKLPYGETYVAIATSELTGNNPQTKGWYVYDTENSKYVPTTDTTPQSGTTYYKKETATYFNMTFDGWALGNVNNSGDNSGYYNTRQFDSKWLGYMNKECKTNYLKYRMVGHTNFFADESGHTTAYRTYFGRDINYDGSTGLLGAELSDDDYTLTNNAVTYTYENTFDENSQIYKNTTYVGIKVTINPGNTDPNNKDFYTIEGQPNTILKSTDLPGEVAKNATATIATAITNINSAISTDLGKTTDAGRQLPTTITDVKYDIEPVITFGEREDDGSMPYTFTLTLKNVKDQNDAAITGEALETINSLASTNLTTSHAGVAKIYKYVGGVAYYATRIAHFGDVETPWDAPNEAYNQYDKVYPTNGQSIHSTPIDFGTGRAEAWLGRWGIVRNNWYRLSIDAITGLGSPVPEDFSGQVGNTPDDNPKPKYYIAAHVHILPWAVRKQSVKF